MIHLSKLLFTSLSSTVSSIFLRENSNLLIGVIYLYLILNFSHLLHVHNKVSHFFCFTFLFLFFFFWSKERLQDQHFLILYTFVKFVHYLPFLCANVYNICYFLCVYNVNLNFKYKVNI